MLRVFTQAKYQPLVCRHFLVGQDSSLTTAPFVTQVHKRITTISEAFASLMPKPVKEAVARGLEVKRQGDWFFVPSGPPQGPGHDMKASVEHTWPGGPPPRKFDPHVLYTAYGDATRHRVLDPSEFHKGEIVYRANSHHLLRGIVRAPDHEDLYLTDWHVAYRANSGPWGRNGRRVGGD